MNIQEVVAWLESQLAGNDVFTGMLALSLFGTAAWAARGLPAVLGSLLMKQVSVELTVFNTDPQFRWFSAWLERHPYARRTRRIQLKDGQGEDERGMDNFLMVPGQGVHAFFYRRRPVLLEHRIDTENSKGGFLRESYNIRILGRGQGAARSLVKEARESSESRNVTRVHYWTGYWGGPVERGTRPLDSVVLPGGQLSGVVDDVTRFLGARQWYTERGVPWRRGYLLSGPPGTGKTSLALALAGHLGLPLYYLNLGSVSDDENLQSAFMSVPQRALLLMEDVDAADSSNHRGQKEEEGGVMTLSGLLNCIDGVASREGRILIMTSNHPERLDPALVRPGRVDVWEELGPLKRDECRRMTERFLPAGEVDTFLDELELPVMPAVLQERLIGKAGR